ncbi:hypothetical protein [Nocardia asteroides]
MVTSRATCARFLPPSLYAELAGIDRWVSASSGSFVPGFTHPEAPGSLAAVVADLPLRSWVQRHPGLFATYTRADLAVILAAWDLVEGHDRAVNLEMVRPGGFLNTPEPGIYIAGIDAADTLGDAAADQVGALLAQADFGQPPGAAESATSYYSWWYGI